MRVRARWRSGPCGVIYKSISGVRSVVGQLGPDHEHRLDNLRWCPTQLQQYVAGTDWGVHVVGDALFACEICSRATDYRYAAHEGVGVELHPGTLLADCPDGCRRLAAALGLVGAGIDLRRTPQTTGTAFR